MLAMTIISGFVAWAGFFPLLVSPDEIGCNQHHVNYDTNDKETDRRFVPWQARVCFGLFTVIGVFNIHGNKK